MANTVKVELTKTQVIAIMHAIEVTNMSAKESGCFDEKQLFNAEQYLQEWQRILEMFKEASND